MSTRARQYDARVIAREVVSPHLVRLVLDAPDFESTGIPDEWVGLVVPGQFQHRYYTVKEYAGSGLVLDVVVHETGLVTEWAARDVVGETVTLTEAKGSFDPAPTARWLMLVGDLTAMPAMARICTETELPVRVWAEVPDDLSGYLPDSAQVSWSTPPGPDSSAIATVVEGIDWPDGEGYFWMAGESSQMRAIRKHLMRDRKLPSHGYDVMGYWRGGGTARQPRAVDPGPIWREGKRAGLSDAEIWQRYDEAAQQ